MKFEKVNNDKIKITLSIDDLLANDIDIHSFMTNSSETQSLFLSVLDKAERDYGFSTDNYKLRVETVALDNVGFILTITRIKELDKSSSSITIRKKPKVLRKNPSSSLQFSSLVYRFNCFDDFCEFVNFLHNSTIPLTNKIAKDIVLYSFNDYCYLIISNLNVKYSHWKEFYSSVTEFGTYITPNSSFIAKIYETGKIVVKHNAIKTCEKYFFNKEQI